MSDLYGIQARTNNLFLIPVIRQNQHPAYLPFVKVEDTLKVKTTKNLTLFLLHKLTRQNQKESDGSKPKKKIGNSLATRKRVTEKRLTEANQK